MRTNKVLEIARQGRLARGCALVFPSAELIELLGVAGFDFVYLDGEHGLFGPESIDAMCRAADAADLTVMARVPQLDPAVINTYLDRGVLGVLGPHIDTADQARGLVDACRFAPEGNRSWGGGRGTGYSDTTLMSADAGGKPGYMAALNREMLVMAQIETVTAIENLDSILEVKGIDAFTFGPHDLAQSMGLPGLPDHPDVVEAMRQTVERVHARDRKMVSDMQVQTAAPALILKAARQFLEENS